MGNQNLHRMDNFVSVRSQNSVSRLEHCIYKDIVHSIRCYTTRRRTTPNEIPIFWCVISMIGLIYGLSFWMTLCLNWISLQLDNMLDHKRTAWGCRGCGRIPNDGKLAIFGQKFWTFGQIIQLHSHLSEVLFVLPSTAKALLRIFCNSFLPLTAK